MADLDRIARNRFVVIGRAGMDFYPEPPGTKTEVTSETSPPCRVIAALILAEEPPRQANLCFSIRLRRL